MDDNYYRLLKAVQEKRIRVSVFSKDTFITFVPPIAFDQRVTSSMFGAICIFAELSPDANFYQNFPITKTLIFR
jgi:hypothetical protein